MDLIAPAIQQYSEQFTSVESAILKELNRETHAKILMPRMLSGHLQGRLLSMLSHMIQPRRILEIGTYTGYSAICLAEGLQEDGLLHTIEINEELESFAKKYFQKAGVLHKIQMHIGNALDIIPSLDEVFDLVFIDADKEHYAAYYDLVFDKVRKDGFIIADNVLWSGKVLNDKKDKDTAAIHAFNKKIAADLRVEHLLLPVRDGIMIVRKVL
jgi:predicted O-methyltransferase YrrM